MPPSLDEVSEFLDTNILLISNNKNGTHFHGRCPICGDSKKSNYKKRFHLQYNSDEDIVWHCFNCNEGGNFYKLHSLITGIDEIDSWKKYNKFKNDRIQKKTKSSSKIKPKTLKNIKKLSDSAKYFNDILKDCLSIDSQPSSYIQTQYYRKLQDFIKNRKITQKIFVAYKGYFQGRIIIPIYDNENIIYFQGRSINDKMEPKYLNPISEKEHIIMNKNMFEKNKYIIITEGIIDADTIINQGTCMIGKELTDNFIYTISPLTDKGIIIVMDNDKDGLLKLKTYIKKYKKCKFFIMPKIYNKYKDLNDLIVNKIINKDDMYDFVVKNSFTSVGCKVKLIC